MTQAQSLSSRLEALAADADGLAREMDFRFLYDFERKVLSIGYDARAQRLEDSCYEVLASEARSAAFVAIAKEDIPQESWLHLGRAHTACDGERVLLSWSGTMFEYLMHGNVDEELSEHDSRANLASNGSMPRENCGSHRYPLGRL